MRAIVIKRYGGPDVLAIEERPDPEPKPGHLVVEVKAFGLNHAEIYFRRGAWGDVAEISGIECVGLVKSDPDGRFTPGQKVAAMVGGMGRSFNGSYAELVSVPVSNFAAIDTYLPWEEFAAIPESYATAWSALSGILALRSDQTVMIRGATSALGQAAVNIAADLGAHIIATTRSAERVAMSEALGARDVLIDTSTLAACESAMLTASMPCSILLGTPPYWIRSRCFGEEDMHASSVFSAVADPSPSSRCSRYNPACISPCSPAPS